MPSASKRSLSKAALIAAVLAVGLSACATQKPTSSGFLSAPAALTAPASITTRYRAAMIETVEYRPSGRVPAKAGEADIAVLRAAYYEALVDAFGERMAITQTPGPDVLRVRAAITGYTLANPTWNAAAMLAPIGPRNGGVATEAEIVDSVTGAPLAQQSLAFNAGFFNSKLTAMFARTAHAKSGFKKHAQALAAQAPAIEAKR